MNGTLIIKSLLISIALISSAQAGTLVVTPNNAYLTPIDWQYRSIATRNWIGCWQYDVLQGTGWFPSTFYYTYTPEIEGNDFIFETDTGFWRNYCAAEMDQYNYVHLEYEAKDGLIYEGMFRVIPGGNSDEATIECWIDESKDIYNQLQCEHPNVNWSNSGTTYIEVLMLE